MAPAFRMASLPDLPMELLTEIIEYFPQFYSHVDAIVRGVVTEEYDRVDVTRALSQTSRAMRNIFLPILWSSAHATFTKRNKSKRVRTRAKMLERRMAGIRKSVYLHPYIQSLVVTLSECTLDNWQPAAEFIRVLDVLVNLRSLTIANAHAQMKTTFLFALAGKVYPSVVALAIPDALADLIRHFPNIQTLTFPATCSSPFAFLRTAGTHCKGITRVNNLGLSGFIDATVAAEALGESLPNITHLLVSYLRLDNLSLLEGMPRLSELCIRHPINDNNPPVADIITGAKQVLRSSRATGRKLLRIQHFRAWGSGAVEREEVFILAG